MKRRYSKKFRQLRKESKISCDVAARSINISRSTLERWERGQAGLDIEKVLELLNLLNVQKIDFFDDIVSEYLKGITFDVSKAYKNNEIEYLNNQSISLISKLDNNILDKKTFLRAAICCNYYFDLTGIDIFPKDCKKMLLVYFSKILSGNEVWHYYDIYFFGNTQSLINSRIIYELAYSLLYFFKNNKDKERELSTAILNTLINAEYSLIKCDLKRAKRFDNLLFELNILDKFAFEKIRYKFMHSLLDFIETNNDRNIRLILTTLEIQELDDLKEGFITAFEQIKNIYLNK